MPRQLQIGLYIQARLQGYSIEREKKGKLQFSEYSCELRDHGAGA